MSLLCKKISKLEKFFTNKLKSQISSLNNENSLLNFPKDLNTSLRVYLNLSDLNTNDNYILHLKENFFKKIIKDVKLEDNFGNKGYYESLKSKNLILKIMLFFHFFNKYDNFYLFSKIPKKFKINIFSIIE